MLPAIEAILFDMNGTLRQRVPDETWQRESVERLLTMLGAPNAPSSFVDELDCRYKSYTAWAKQHQVGLAETEIWTKWITPELPRERIESQATELMLALRNCKGRSVLKPEAAQVIAELHWRGYRMGLVSNTTSTADAPRFLDEYGLTKYFQVVILSAVSGYRKPSPEIFWQATRAMQLDPNRCAYLGNKVSSDIVGSRKAGFAMAIIIEPIGALPASASDEMEKPDMVIHTLGDLLDIFPPRS